MIEIKSTDGVSKKVEAGTRFVEILKDLTGKPAEVVAVRINEELKDITSKLEKDSTVSFILKDSKEGHEILRHSTSHLMALAVTELFPGVKVTIGPSIEEGFYYDFDLPNPLTLDDLAKIESKMKEFVKQDLKFERMEVGRDEAIRIFKEKNEPYKIEIIEDIPDKILSLYKLGNFLDLCRGPHLQKSSLIKAFKLVSFSGSYWRGDEKKARLQRIYGTAFFSKEALENHLKMVEEAKQRDHRKLGKELDLFSISDAVGGGLVLWHPKGAQVRELIENYWKDAHRKNGYHIVYTPHIAKINLWATSGHLDFYKDYLYSPMDVDDQKYMVKPMNCPFHIQIYKSSLRSYRDLPIKYAELGTVYRYERAGVLHGLLRVRGFTQDDAHIFCRPDQLDQEIKDVLDLTVTMLNKFGFDKFEIYLSTKPAKYVGSDENWERATAALKKALEDKNMPYSIDPGEGVFYGPKIDIKIKDSLGRAWQCTTCQVDFNLPEKFAIEYVDRDNKRVEPIMIHRALLGSLERFMGCLTENYNGAFPLWLAPVQVKVLTVKDDNIQYGKEVALGLSKCGFRVETDFRNEKLSYKIREAQLAKIPYMLILGDGEMNAKTVSPRKRTGDLKSNIALEEFKKMLNEDLNL